MSENSLKYRIMSSILPPPEAGRRLIILTGARQTGKTTLAKLKYPNLRYINLDAPENREDIRNVLTAAWPSTIGNAIIDEAQKEPTVFEKIKYAYDEGGISFSILLGSSQILLLKKIRESLAGRVAIFELWPLLMSEINAGDYPENYAPDIKASTKTPLIDKLLSGGMTKNSVDKILSSLPQILLDKEKASALAAEDYLLKWGGMPALLRLSSDTERWQWLKNYQYTYLEKDLIDLARLDDLGPFTKFQKLTALRSGKLLNYSELARDAGVSVDTARRYLEYLRLSYQVILLQPYYKNITSSVIKTPKLYWLDIGLLRQLSGQRAEDTGEIYETMVVGEIYKWIKTIQKNAEMFFYRTRSGFEIDLLLNTESGLLGMEVKNRQTITASDISNMKDVAKALGKEWTGGILIHKGDEIRKLSNKSDENIWAVPSKRLFG